MTTLYLNQKNRQIILYELQNIIVEKLKTKEFNELIDFFKNEIIKYYNKNFLKDMKILEKYKLTKEFDIIKLIRHNSHYIVNFCKKDENYYYYYDYIFIQLDKKLKITSTAKIRYEIDDYLKTNHLEKFEQLSKLHEVLNNKIQTILYSFSEIINNYRTWNQLTKNHPEFNIIDINKLFPNLNKNKKKNKKNSDEKLKEATKNIKEFNKLLKEE
jgi:hypothetical protein